jgi:two-component system, OmpR family, sensor histidine kinase BaeS
MRPPFFSRPRPAWWPPSEPWPPPARHYQWRQWRRDRRGHFFWRVAALLGFLLFFTLGGCALTLGFMASGLGLIHFPGSDVLFSRAVSLTALLIGLLGVLITGRALRQMAVSVDDLMEAAGRVETGDYAARVAEHGSHEMRALMRAFNTMTARLQLNEERRRNWLADVTHELRTPLTVIQGDLEGLLDGVYPPDEAHLAPILEETHVLARLIDDLRTLSQAESGMLKLQKELTDLGVLVSEAAAAFRVQAEKAGVELTVSLADDLPLAEVDPTRIREVLSNLIANALRYTPPGGQIRVQGQPDGAGRCVALSVGDTGAGIAADILPHIFDRFYKSADSGGMGLGLAIAKDLVAAHGGEITAHSQPGSGTTIRFTLPL